MTPFVGFPKIARLNREVVITEKIDGTNAQVFITEGTKTTHPEAIAWWRDHLEWTDYVMLAGSRNRWLTLKDDNYGFAAWVAANHVDLMGLGKGSHFGEWWGSGIQRNYGLKEKRFSLFNVHRWVDPIEKQKLCPTCCDVVPVLRVGLFDSATTGECVRQLRTLGSMAAPGFMQPEGIVIYHTAAGTLFKVTLENDEKPKSA
jgi:hypothetical protein